MIDAPGELELFVREFAHVVHDLGEIAPRRLSVSPEVRAGLLALKVVHAEEIPPELLDEMTGGPVAGSAFEFRVSYCALHCRAHEPDAAVAGGVAAPDRWEALMGTVAQAWIGQGVERGRSEGQAGILLRLLELRFGDVPDAVRERVRGASAAELEAWADAVLVAASLDEVLAAGNCRADGVIVRTVRARRREPAKHMNRVGLVSGAAAMLAIVFVACPPATVALERKPGLASGVSASAVTASLVVAATRAVARLMETDDGARVFAAHALALRAAIVKGSGYAVLSRIPGGSRSAPPGMWPAFFRNTMVGLGRLRSPGPVALYYNPLLDVAVATHWAVQDDGWRVAAARAFPGESFGSPPRAAGPSPSWLQADAGMVEALSVAAASRLAEFHRLHPPAAQSAAKTSASFAEDAERARAALPRLLRDARQRAGWTSDARAWLRPTLARVTAALSSGDAGAVTAAAPATDPATAQAVADLPEGLAARLVLDMVLDAGADRRLLIGSLPEDGQVYFLVQCRLEGAACSLRRIVIVSLLDTIGAADAARQKEG